MTWTWLRQHTHAHMAVVAVLMSFWPGTGEPGIPLSLGATSAQAAEGAAEFTLAEGEIRFDGQILSITPEQSLFTLAVTTFTNPNGRSGKIEPPKPRQIAVSDATTLHVRGDAKLKLDIKDLAAPNTKTYAVIIGRDGGAGQPLQARQVAAWDMAEGGRYSLRNKMVAPVTDSRQDRRSPRHL